MIATATRTNERPVLRFPKSAVRRASTGVVVVIPALNEEDAIGKVLVELPNVDRVIVVDNGSKDATADVARAHGAYVVEEPRRGYGSACLCGLAEIVRLREDGTLDPRVVVFLDADHSDDPGELTRLVRPVLDGDADMVLGSRSLGVLEPGAMPIQAILGNKLACGLMNFFWSTDYTDLGPFRAVDYAALRSLGMSDPDFGWTIEMQIKAARADLQTTEIPVPYRRRIGTSKISGTVVGTVRAGWKILYTIAKYAVSSR